LITNAQVRYEGTLVEVDKAERSMKLKSVKSFGTEGRRGGVNEVDAQE
jgi:protein LSM14